MKNVLLFITIIFAFNATSYAQNTFPSSGNVGIGTTSPTVPLDVRGIIAWGSGVGALGNDPSGSIELGPANSTLADPYIDFHYGVGSVQDYNVRLVNSGNNLFCISTQLSGSNMVFAVNGNNVGVGTTDTKGYRFAVNGSAIATSMTVKLYSTWPDYVFAPTYKLPSLPELKYYIGQYHHLPEVPSQDDVDKNGLDLGEMNKVLTKKVEELTLYLIELSEKNKSEQQQIDELKKEIDNLAKK